MRRSLIAVFAAFALTLLAGCTPDTIGSAEDQKLIVTRPAAEGGGAAGPQEDIEYKIFALRAYQFGYEPDVIEAEHGDHVMLTVTSVDVGHGFALPDFGINEKIPPEESVTFRFRADKAGEFRFFNPVYSGKGWKDMEGTLIVRNKSAHEEVE